MMRRDAVRRELAAGKPQLVKRYGVTRLALFGSIARNEARPDSDVDIVVGFDGPATSARYFGVQFYLENELGCTVDLVTEEAIRPELRPYIEREAVNVSTENAVADEQEVPLPREISEDQSLTGSTSSVSERA